jgi:hypothetical protein
LTIENIAFSPTLVLSATFTIDSNQCFVDIQASTSTHLRLFDVDGTITIRSATQYNRFIGRNSRITKWSPSETLTSLFAVQLFSTSCSCDIDTNLDLLLSNSFVDGNVIVADDLEKNNSVITGTETVSGTTTSRQAKVFDDSVEFKQNVLADKLAANVAAQLNNLDVGGGAAIGSGYAGIATAPANGLIIEGPFGVGINSPDKPFHFKSSTDMTLRLERDGGGFFDIIVANTRLSVGGGNTFNIAVPNTGFGTQSPAAKVDIRQLLTTAAIPALRLAQADLSEEMIKFDATIGVGNPIEAKAAKTLTGTHFVKANIEGVGNVYVEVGTIA